MKKLLSLLMIICCLGLWGCEAADRISGVELPPIPTSQASEELSEPEAPQTSITETEHQHIIINFDRKHFEAYDPQQGTALILSFSYETPYVHIPAKLEAEEKINEFVAMLDESFYTGDDYGVVFDSGLAPGYNNMLTMAEDNYNYIVNSAINFEGNGFELANHRTVSIERCDDELLTLLYYDYVNLGGVHGGYGYRAYCFDTESGELLSIEKLASDNAGFRAFLVEYMLETVANDPELQQRVNGFVDMEGLPTLEEAVTALIRDGNWYFDGEGMHIFSDLYEMASYAAGIIEFKIPYCELEEYIGTDYTPDMPDESASLGLVPVDAMAESGREIIDMLRTGEAGEALCLIVDGTALDVSIARVDYTDHFYETERLWYCSRMNDCAMQLVTLVPEGMPELKISYTDALGEHELYLSQSGVDGSFVLVDDSIEAVG